MTLVIYEPEGPALEFIGHAGAGLCGRDPVCAALSILMYTLIEAVPTAAVSSGDGYCRIDAGTEKNQTAAQRSGCGLEKEEGGSRSAAFVTPHGSGAERASFDVGYCRIEASTGKNQTAAQRSGCGLEKEEGGSRSAAFVTPHGSGAERASSDAAFCRPESSVKQNTRASFDVVLGGLRLLAGSFPQYVQLKEKTRTEPSIRGSVRERRKEGTDMELSKRFEEAEWSELLPAR